MLKTTWNDVSAKNVEQKDFIATLFDRKHGKSTIKIVCPFCDTKFFAYIWSLAGIGKRCPDCGAMFGSGGVAYKRRDLNERQSMENRGEANSYDV